MFMEIEIINQDKNEMEFKLDNLTLAELLRVYLNRDSSVEIAVWKREHPSEKPTFKLKTKGKTAKKAISDSISEITKELDSVEKDFEKMK